MEDEQLPAEEQSPGADTPEQAIVISPTSDQPIVADTVNLESEAGFGRRPLRICLTELA